MDSAVVLLPSARESREKTETKLKNFEKSLKKDLTNEIKCDKIVELLKRATN